ncbi:MAG: glycoside hydrolase family 2 protein [Bacteroidota bacterium]|nr:glycoside hydrolase family 2 protein [Bacteroidota bacterium]
MNDNYKKTKNNEMMKRVIATVVFGMVMSGISAQISWPSVTQQTKPWARWWWEGSAVDKNNLTANMQDYKAAGLGGLEITPIYGVKGYEDKFIKFLSPQWMQMLDYTLAEAKRLGLGIDIANGTGWPFGGPWIKDKDASKTVVYKNYQLNGGDELKEKVFYKQEGFVRTANTTAVKPEQLQHDIASNKDLQALALDQVKFSEMLPLKLLMAYSNDGQILNVTGLVDAQGKLNWKAPEGKWNLYALFEGLHGKMVERAAPGGEGYAIDHFSKEALHTFLNKFDEAFKGHDVSYVRALFNDSYEVDDARGQSNWTPRLFDEFQKRRGYDLRKYLPALFQKSDADTNRRVIYDYRSTIDELILDYFTKEWKKWGITKGAIIRNQSHGSPANLLDLYGAIDIPETEGNDIPRYKFATSAGNVMGKSLISSESATWLNEHFLSSLADVKKIVDLFFLGGVNHIFYHGVNYSPKEAQWPGWLFYAAVHFQQTNPQWKDFHALNEYVARTQSFLQKGRPDNDVLMFYPLVDRYMDPGNNLLQHFDNMEHEFNGTDFQKLTEKMLASGDTFDFFSDRQLQNITAAGNKLVTGGNVYQTILLPNNKYISEKSFQKLVELAKAGARILVYKNMPADVPGLNHLTERRAVFQQLINQLKFTERNNIKIAAVGKGYFAIGDDVDRLLAAAGVFKENMLLKGLQFVRRKNVDGYTYFINNRTEKTVSDWIPLNKKAVAVAMFDAMTGKSGLARYRAGVNGNVEVLLQLPPAASVIVETFSNKKSGSAYPYVNITGAEQPIKGEWTITFLDGGPTLPASYKTTKLASWTAMEDKTYKNFSGTAMYTVSFDKPTGNASAWLLDLGKVNETAEVVLNGKKLATLIGPDFKIVVPASVLKPTNTLGVTVANLMANRIIYMDKNNIPWKKFYNINMSAKKRENLKNGIFDASSWQPLPSGLSGPVTIAAIDDSGK